MAATFFFTKGMKDMTSHWACDDMLVALAKYKSSNAESRAIEADLKVTSQSGSTMCT